MPSRFGVPLAGLMGVGLRGIKLSLSTPGLLGPDLPPAYVSEEVGSKCANERREVDGLTAADALPLAPREGGRRRPPRSSEARPPSDD